MRGKLPIRGWWAAVVCGLLGLSTLSVSATTPTKKPANSSTTSTVKSTRSKGHQTKAAHSSAKGKHSRKKTKVKRSRKQEVIESERARQIQQALIREHYLEGEPSGKWDDETQAALRRYQADQGWQSKTVPDSRALIKLGLGPDREHLLNPESAMTTAPAVVDPKVETKPRAADPPSTPADNPVPQP
jgi:peptidoglycan hydrolase-like protein with peptidoglycan-binding domain